VHVPLWIATGIVLGLALGWGTRPALARALATRSGAFGVPRGASENGLLSGLGDIERRIVAHIVRRDHMTRDVNAEFEQQLTFGQRLADRIAAAGGSWWFISVFLASLFAWIAYNVERPTGFDPYPFILLNLLLSCLAALQAPVIMMSQNRMAAKDRLDARHDYEVNLKAEMEITQMLAKIEELRDLVATDRRTD
jgi:uncharacterized membrane protein